MHVEAKDETADFSTLFLGKRPFLKRSFVESRLFMSLSLTDFKILIKFNGWLSDARASINYINYIIWFMKY